MRVQFFLLIFLSLCILCPAQSFAASIDMGKVHREQEQIILQQEERIRQQEKQLLRHREQQQLKPERIGKVPEKEDDPCMQVAHIQVEGAKALPSSVIDDILQPHINQCLSLAAINNILRDLSNAYIDRGYITSRAFITTEEQAPNTLGIVILEGTIEKILINDGDRNYYYRGRTAFPWMEGRIANLRDIEQGLDQLNRLPSQDASMELVPGDSLGGSILRVSIPKRRTWRIGLGMDNLGQKSTGEWQYTASFEKDNALGLGDQWAIYWSEDAPFLEDAQGRKRSSGNNQSLSVYASFPWGYWTFSASMSFFRYNTIIEGQHTDYKSSGDTNMYSVQAERVLHRDADSKTSLSVGLSSRHVNNYIEDIRLKASSYIINTLATELSHFRRFLGGALSLGITHTQGIPHMGTTKEEEHGYAVPKSYFHKFSGTLSWYRPWQLMGQDIYTHISGYGQLTRHTLYGAERISIGSRYSVRGFHQHSATGDQGGYLRCELGWNIPGLHTQNKILSITGVQAYSFYDIGALLRDRDDPYEKGRLQGAGVGIRTMGDVAFDLSVAKAFDAPSYLKKRDMEVYMSLRISY